MCNEEEEEEGQLQNASKYTMSQEEEEEGQLQNASKYTMLQEEEEVILL